MERATGIEPATFSLGSRAVRGNSRRLARFRAVWRRFATFRGRSDGELLLQIDCGPGPSLANECVDLRALGGGDRDVEVLRFGRVAYFDRLRRT